MSPSPAHSHEDLVFLSVFPPPSLVHSTPTPEATPVLGSSAFGQSFGGFHATTADLDAQDPATRQVRRNLAWSAATRFLSLPRPAEAESFTAVWGSGTERTPEVTDALKYLLVGDGAVGFDRQDDSLLEWYGNEVRSHFTTYVHPNLQAIWGNAIDCDLAWKALEETVGILRHFQSLYTQPLLDHILPIVHEADLERTRTQGDPVPAEAPRVASRFRRDFHAVVRHSLPTQRFSKTLSYVLWDGGCRLFRLYAEAPTSLKGAKEDSINTKKRIIGMLRGLQEVGLGEDQAQRAFAHAMDKLMSSFIISHYMKVDWYGRSSVTKQLRQWVKDGFSPFVRQVMECLTGDPGAIHLNEVRQWQEMAIGRLGRARVDNLFDYIVNWDRSLGAILDLKEYITTPAARAHLANAFSQQLLRRLLHAGATTTHILDVYIYVIRAFNELDPKGVLLERVARPIRRYLKDRDDTARIIVSSLLADIEDEDGNRIDPGGEISLELATEMKNPINPDPNEREQDLDFNNMNWTPDPVDASPEYKKSKPEDVIAYLLSLYDREDFISELRTLLGAHLLKEHSPHFEKEHRLLHLFQVRLGEDKLQACEVMLRDIEDSERINRHIRAAAGVNGAMNDLGIDLTSQVLSAFFWPALREEEFRLPPEVSVLQQEYAAEFELYKDMRKLHWLPALGKALVELQLEDRTVELEVLPWQASLIHAFQDPEAEASAGPVTRSVEQLEEMLEMDEALVRNALTFWVGKLVLEEVSPGVYGVIERLSADGDAAATAAVAAEEAAKGVSAVKSQEDVLVENMGLYRQFVIGMLTNQGQMPVQRILVMLKMVVPGGFPFGEEDIRTLLGRMAAEGVIVGSGDVFGVRKA